MVHAKKRNQKCDGKMNSTGRKRQQYVSFYYLKWFLIRVSNIKTIIFFARHWFVFSFSLRIRMSSEHICYSFHWAVSVVCTQERILFASNQDRNIFAIRTLLYRIVHLRKHTDFFLLACLLYLNRKIVNTKTQT